MNSMKKIMRLADDREYLLAMEILFNEIEIVSKEKDCEEKALKLVELSFGELMLKYGFKEAINRFILNLFNSYSDWLFLYCHLINGAVEARNLYLLDKIYEDDIENFKNGFEKLNEQTVGTCYENGRVFVFAFDKQGIKITIFDLALDDRFEMKIGMSDFKLNLDVFLKRMDAYYCERYLEVKLDKVTAMIKKLYEQYPVLALI